MTRQSITLAKQNDEWLKNKFQKKNLPAKVKR
jgi:hypothetical protein